VLQGATTAVAEIDAWRRVTLRRWLKHTHHMRALWVAISADFNQFAFKGKGHKSPVDNTVTARAKAFNPHGF
jgi:hypothetical protein